MSTLTLKELSAPTGEVIKIAAGKTLDLKSQGSVTMPTGSVIQVVQNATNSPSYTNASGSYVAIADMTVTITPQSSSSKVLVTFNCGGSVVGQSTNQEAIHARIKRGSTVVRELGRYGFNRNDDYSSLPVFLTFLDSPNTTSATTYTLEMKVNNGTLQMNRDNVLNGSVTIAQEIAG